jgi:hypothetical protein
MENMQFDSYRKVPNGEICNLTLTEGLSLISTGYRDQTHIVLGQVQKTETPSL